MIHTALNTLKNLSANRSVRAQNMSNLNVPGHRKDLNTNFTSGFLHQVNQYDTRVFAIHDGANGFSNKQGQLNPTGQETDIAINGPGFLWFNQRAVVLHYQDEVIFLFLTQGF